MYEDTPRAGGLNEIQGWHVVEISRAARVEFWPVTSLHSRQGPLDPMEL